jgi:hypothetical protein
MKRIFITNKKLSKYRECISSFAIYLGKRCKYYNNIEKLSGSYLNNFILEYDKLDFSKLNTYVIPNYKINFLSYLITCSYKLKENEMSSLLYDLINIIGVLEDVEITYIDHLFKNDSIFEYGFKDISYKEYVNYLKEKYDYSDEEIKEITLTTIINK